MCSSFALLEDDSYALPRLPDHTRFSSAFIAAESSLFITRAPYVKLFSTDRYYRFGFDDPYSYFVLGCIGVALAVVLQIILAPLKKLFGATVSAGYCAWVSCASIAVGVVCGVWISKPTLLPPPLGIIQLQDHCCSQAHLYAGGNSSVTRGVAAAVVHSVDLEHMYDISLADLAPPVMPFPLAHKPSLFGHAGIASSRLSSTRTHFIDHIEE